jgi:hypothetical protein
MVPVPFEFSFQLKGCGKMANIEMGDAVNEMIEMALVNNWFVNCGSVCEPDKDVVWVSDWREVSRHYSSIRLDNYITRSINGMCEPIWTMDQKMFNTMLIPVGKEIESHLEGKLVSRIESAIPLGVKRRSEIAKRVESLVVWACNETYWSERVKFSPLAFNESFKWFMAGHLSCCGALPYPSLRLYVY